MHMKRVMLIIAYDGTNYVGWQKQPNGTAVEEIINKCLCELTGENIEIIGASRTDSGVHAMGNVAVFNTESRIPAEKFCFALNQRLPEDIVVQKSFEVDESFHPRHADCTKTYEYKIYNNTHISPFMRKYSYFEHRSLDLEAMRRGAGFLIGEHDFASFCSANAQVKSTVRTVYSIDVIEDEPHIITIRVKGNGFLYNMIRIITGTLLQVGKHEILPEKVGEMLAAKDRSASGPTAPPQGLKLVNIEYSDKSFVK